MSAAGYYAIALLMCALAVKSDVKAASGPSETWTTPQDSARTATADTLPPYRNVNGASRDSVELVKAASDALNGKSGIPLEFLVISFRRAHGRVTIDMKPQPIPNVVMHGAGGTVRILADGRRVILSRHD